MIMPDSSGGEIGNDTYQGIFESEQGAGVGATCIFELFKARNIVGIIHQYRAMKQCTHTAWLAVQHRFVDRKVLDSAS